MTEPLWTIEDVAGYLRVGKTKAYELASDPRAPHCIRVGKSRRWLASDWSRWAERMLRDRAV
jgi:predicted DNA-binding transcriptional regulator AlpA